MSTAARNPNQQLINLWLVQLVGTMVIAAVVVYFYRNSGSPFKDIDPKWAYFALYGIVLAIAPATMYLRRYKEWLLEDHKRTQAQGGVPHPAVRQGLLKSLSLGGAMAELPQALGVVHLFLGGEMRWFMGATLISLALRLSYRPFLKPSEMKK